jgi:hypothetical protein
MKLISFRITNYRSINDSGSISVAKMTTLVGRNESGKSNLLLALAALNPAGGIKPLSSIKDFPRHRPLTECNDDTPAVAAKWTLDAAEQAALVAIFPRAAGVTQVEISRSYKAKHRVRFIDLKPFPFSVTQIKTALGEVIAVVNAVAEKLEAEPRAQAEAAGVELAQTLSAPAEPPAWAARATPALSKFRQALATANIAL